MQFASSCLSAVVGAPCRSAPRCPMCFVLPGLFLCVPLTWAGSAANQHLLVLLLPKTSCSGIRDFFQFPHTTSLSWKLQWPIIFSICTSTNVLYVSCCMYKELKNKVFICQVSIFVSIGSPVLKSIWVVHPADFFFFFFPLEKYHCY